ncbi:hypothetical protein FOXB_16237 [Fusarium oxysporum f. sp. conglutinans Fo5176]|uniref:Uncharacterized protein n=1 Tax=Fusarium oxysporum (strain Fo5176) TaxID=660025 RepID=F9GC54_FUSOF|nr:hypothetical protein FOXB_16237 [Fusarium oxysporum f. sp. conglutinans Fo5176]
MASIASIIAAVLRAMYTWSKQTFDQVERQNTLTSPPHETVELYCEGQGIFHLQIIIDSQGQAQAHVRGGGGVWVVTAVDEVPNGVEARLIVQDIQNMQVTECRPGRVMCPSTIASTDLQAVYSPSLVRSVRFILSAKQQSLQTAEFML